jgi:hypothetical protein
MVEVLNPHHAHGKDAPMVYATPTQVLLTTTLQPLVTQLSGLLAQAVSLLEQFLSHEPTPQAMATFERELSALLRAVGHCVMTWVCNHIEPANPADAPSRLWFGGRAYRRRRTYRGTIATLFGTVVVWRLLYEPLEPGMRSIHPLELRLGLEVGVATPALAERIGSWAADHTQRQVLEMLVHDHGVHWSCTTLRKLLASLSAGMAEHRHTAQVEKVVGWLQQARGSKGRWQPTLAVGRDGVNVPLRHRAWKEGATATVSVLDRRGKRLGTVYLGQMPESGQGTLTQQLTTLLQDILRHVESQSLRLVYVSDDGYHPSDYYHSVLRQMHDPRRPWRTLEWIRIVDYYHACLYIRQLADALFGPGVKGRRWAHQMRTQLKTQSDGLMRVLQSASALRRQHGVWGNPKNYDQAYAYLKKRRHWMCYKHYSSQRLPIGSGITEAACKTVFTQRLKRSGMSWTGSGGQVIVDLRVIWLSGIWDQVHQAYLASKPMPMTQIDMEHSTQRGQKAA